MTNESHADYHKKISSYLQQCVPDQYMLNINKMNKLLSLNIRDVAWMLAILEKRYQYAAIPWKDSSLRKRVDLLHEVFLTKIDNDTAIHAEKNEFNFLTYESKLKVIHQLIGVTWEIIHDYKEKAIGTYRMHFNTEQSTYNTTLNGVISAYNATKTNTNDNYTPIGLPTTFSLRTEEQGKILEGIKLPILPWNAKNNKAARADQIMTLVGNICVQNPLRIDLDKLIKLETINSYNLAFVIAICLQEYQTSSRVNFSDFTMFTGVINIQHEMWNILEKEIHSPEVTIKATNEVDIRSDLIFTNLSANLPPALARLWIEKACIEATTHSQYQKTSLPEDLPKKYTDTAVNVAVVQTILPEQLPDKNQIIDGSKKRALAWQCFQELPGALKSRGCTILESIITVQKRVDARINFIDEYGETISITYDSFRHTFQKLLLAYLHELSLDKKRF